MSGKIPHIPMFNVPETFGKALSYEGQIHAIFEKYNEQIESVNDTIDALEDAMIDNIPDGGVSTIKLADGAVTTPKIADGCVTASKIAYGAVTDAKLQKPKVNTPLDGSGNPNNGIAGQLLCTLGNGNTEWASAITNAEIDAITES